MTTYEELPLKNYRLRCSAYTCNEYTCPRNTTYVTRYCYLHWYYSEIFIYCI